MTARDRQQLLRLAVELAADIGFAAEKSARLSGWVNREAIDDEVLIPAALIHHFYTAVETALGRVVVVLEGSQPEGPDSHSRLLSLASLEMPGIRPVLLSPGSVEALRELLGFRHLFRHGYGAQYRPARIRELAGLAVGVWPKVKQELEQVHQFVSSCAETA